MSFWTTPPGLLAHDDHDEDLVYGEQGEGTVTSDVVNTAARIQSVAPVPPIAARRPLML